MPATEGTDASAAMLQPILDRLGPYPHRKLNASSKKQTTRMIKAVCPGTACANDKGATYTVRLSRAWLEVATPNCPVCDIEMIADT